MTLDNSHDIFVLVAWLGNEECRTCLSFVKHLEINRWKVCFKLHSLCSHFWFCRPQQQLLSTCLFYLYWVITYFTVGLQVFPPMAKRTYFLFLRVPRFAGIRFFYSPSSRQDNAIHFQWRSEDFCMCDSFYFPADYSSWKPTQNFLIGFCVIHHHLMYLIITLQGSHSSDSDLGVR